MSVSNSKDNNKKITIILAVVLVLAVIACIFIVVGMNGKKGSKEVVKAAAHDYEQDGYLTLGDYKGVSVDVTVTDENVADEINFILEDQDLYEQVQGVAADGQLINISFGAYSDGKEIEDYSESDVCMNLGDEEYYSEFDSAIVGMNTGDTKTIPVEFPSDYGDELVDGKTIDFEVTLNYICGNPIKQELTDDFVKEYSEGECTSVDDFNEYIRNTLYQDNVDSIKETAWETALGNTEISEYHQGEVDIAVEEEKNRYDSMSELTGQDVYEMFGMTEDDVKEIGEEVARERMVAKTIAAKDNLVMDDASYEQLLREYMTDEETDVTSMTLAEIEASYKESYMDEPREAMFLEYIKNYVNDNANIIGMK